jgi:hypothetical protein
MREPRKKKMTKKILLQAALTAAVAGAAWTAFVTILTNWKP